MANIEKELKAIMEAEYGEEVRSSIHDAIKAGNDEIVEYGLKEKERSEAEAERSEAETARMAAEAERRQAETERAGAETVRATEESARQTAEEARIVAETERAEAEEVREQSETARMSAETERVLEENERQQREAVRISGENERLEAERYRVQEEVLRAQAEATRIAAEELREEVKAAAEAAAEAANEAAKRADEAATGGVSKMIVNFEEPESMEPPKSGETVGTLFGKMKRWFTGMSSGAGSTLLDRLLPPGRVLISDEAGKVAQSDVSVSDLANLSGTTGNLQEQITQLNGNILLNVYPVGSIYMSVSNTNPGTLFGGSWEAWGSGRMPVGVNASDTNLNAAEKTGGSAHHVHSSPQHTHGINSHSHTMAHTHTINGHSHPMTHTHVVYGHSHPINDHSHNVTGYAHVDISVVNKKIYIDRSGTTTSFGAVSLSGSTASDQEGAGNHSTARVYGTAGTPGLVSTNKNANANTSDVSTANTKGSGTLTSNASSAVNTGGTALTTNNNAAANTGSASSYPPYITCYMWKRIS